MSHRSVKVIRPGERPDDHPDEGEERDSHVARVDQVEHDVSIAQHDTHYARGDDQSGEEGSLPSVPVALHDAQQDDERRDGREVHGGRLGQEDREDV